MSTEMRNASLLLVVLILPSVGCGKAKSVKAVSKAIPNPALSIARFSGKEEFKVKEAIWDLIDGGTESSRLFLNVECGKATKTLDDTRELHAEPEWSLFVNKANLTEIQLVPGVKFTIESGAAPETESGWNTNFYYVSHMGTNKNTVEIIEVDGDRLLIRLSGECEDVNNYDDSKSVIQLKTKVWFRKR